MLRRWCRADTADSDGGRDVEWWYGARVGRGITGNVLLGEDERP